jgi:hypothetical protein
MNYGLAFAISEEVIKVMEVKRHFVVGTAI